LCAKSQSDDCITIRSEYCKTTFWGSRAAKDSSVPTVAYDTLPKPQQKGTEMPPKKTYPFNGQQITGETVEVETSSEPWAQYKLADGTTVKAKLVMLEAVRLDTHSDSNDPVYQFQFQQIIGVVADESLKRKVH